MNIPSQITTLLIGITLTLLSLWYGQSNNLMPIAASAEAPPIDNLFNLMLTIGTGIFLLVMGVLIYATFKFRRQPDDLSDGPAVHGNIPLEILWTAIPAIIVLGISVYSFSIYTENAGDPMDHTMAHHHTQTTTAQMTARSDSAIAAPLVESTVESKESGAMSQGVADAVSDKPVNPATSEMTVNVAGMQYAWIFTYPDTEVVAGELHVPVGRTIRLDLTANDVLHAFWVPEFRMKQDAIPGRASDLRFTPTREGEYPIVCAELCGAYHGAMRSKVIVESPAAFDTWMQSQKVASAEVMNRAIAAAPAQMTESEYLAPYAVSAGVTQAALKQLHSGHHQTGHHQTGHH